MAILRNLHARFFPPDKARRRYTLLGSLALVGCVFGLVVAPPVWEYTNSTPFCANSCHTMPPAFESYRESPHARVPCVDCHIGRGLLIEQFARKSGHARLLWATLTGDFEYPIRVSHMRPAMDTCELCHFPEKFSDDSFRVVRKVVGNESNDLYDIYLLMHTGGGSAREGLGQGIHWHVENRIEFVESEDESSVIPWVRVTRVDGQVTEYREKGSDFSPEGHPLHQMDCIDCHNRITHEIPSPEELVDRAIRTGTISDEIPFIRRQAVEALTAAGHDVAEPEAVLRGIAAWYEAEYPAFMKQGAPQVQAAIDELMRLRAITVFEDQQLDWRTHPDHVGHKDWAGCFRCHDGKHVDAEGNAVRLECNLCHGIPKVVTQDVSEPLLALATGIEPDSHKTTTWIVRHRTAFDDTCATCHDVRDPGGATDTGFCSNSQCHGVKWKFAWFDGPSGEEEIDWETAMPGSADAPPDTTGGAVAGAAGSSATPASPTWSAVGSRLARSCGGCHGAGATAGLTLTSYEGLMKGGKSGPVVRAGDAASSLLVRKVEKGHFAKLAPDDLAAVKAWIDAGARGGGGPSVATSGPAVAATPSAGGEGGAEPGDEPVVDAGGDFHALREVGPDGQPCIGCHADQASVLGTRHTSASASPCISCHVPGMKAPYRMATITGVNPASGRCVACHDGGTARKPGFTSHPKDAPLTTEGLPFALAGPSPYFSPDGKPARGGAGEITCLTCHAPHGGTGGKKLLRKSASVSKYCGVCHGDDGFLYFSYFHKGTLRKGASAAPAAAPGEPASGATPPVQAP